MKNYNNIFELSEWQLINQTIRAKNIQYSDDNNTVSIFNDFNAGSDLTNIYKLGEAIALDCEEAFDIQRDKQGNFKTAKPLKIAKMIQQLKNANTDYQTRYYCHDYISAVLEAMLRHSVYSFNSFCISVAESNEQQALAINGFIAEVRKVLSSEKVRERIRNRHKNAYKNYVSAIAYVDALFDQYTRLCVVRVDLDYKRLSDGSMVSQEETRHDIKALLNCIKTQALFENCVGHMGKMEFGHEKGYHFHMVFFFDGSKEIHDAYLGDKIGELWCKELTSGQGIYHNCNRNKLKEYGDKCGIGMVHHADQKRRNNLEYAIGYTVKADQFILAKPTGRSRVFFRGQSPKGRKSKAGRPREQFVAFNQ